MKKGIFIEVGNYNRLREGVNFLQEFVAAGEPTLLGTLIGEPGIGKTTSITRYCVQNHSLQIEASPTWQTLRRFLVSLNTALGNDQYLWTEKLENSIIESLIEKPHSCIFVDEADYIRKVEILEMIRSLASRTRTPFVLITTGPLLKRLYVNGKPLPKYLHITQRIMAKIYFNSLSAKEAGYIIDALNITPPVTDEAKEYITQRGNTRFMIDVLRACEKMGRVNNLSQVSLAAIKKAEMEVEEERSMKEVGR